MKKIKQTVHFVDNYLINPTNPVTVNLIGAGGTGSQVLTALARINQSLVALNHAGLQVTLFDDDVITVANLGRQLFAEAEVGLCKSVALINRINRFFGTNWKAVDEKFTADCHKPANIYISCVDTVSARFEIEAILKPAIKHSRYNRDKPMYWMDFGNSQYTGQVLLSTVGDIVQPSSKRFNTSGLIPFMTEEYKELFEQAKDDNTPSCSLAEALTKQDLFINSALANLGASLLWQMFSEGMLTNRGFFMNIKDFRTTPVVIVPAATIVELKPDNLKEKRA